MPKRVEQDNGKSPINLKDKLIELGKIGANYLRLKGDEKKMKAEITKENTALKSVVKESPELFETNGKHKEVYAPMGDGINEVFIQVQKRESIKMVDNVVQLVKDKLGEGSADNFIMTVEVLHDNALEAMKNQGLISDEDILEWTTIKETESLIVKANKKRG